MHGGGQHLKLQQRCMSPPLYQPVNAAVDLVHEASQALPSEIAGLHLHVVSKRIVGIRPPPYLRQDAAQLRHGAGLAARGRLPQIPGTKYLLQSGQLLLLNCLEVQLSPNRDGGPDMSRGTAIAQLLSSEPFAERPSPRPPDREGRAALHA